MDRTNNGIARAFLKERNSRGSNTGDTFHFENDLLYSYNTLIAKYDTDKGIVFLADECMTPTTAKHRQSLYVASFDEHVKVFTIPMVMGQREFPTDEQVLARYESRLDYNSMGTELALADKRREFALNFERYKEFIELSGTKSENFQKYQKIYNNLENFEYIKLLQKKRREYLKNADNLFVDTINDSRYFS